MNAGDANGQLWEPLIESLKVHQSNFHHITILSLIFRSWSKKVCNISQSLEPGCVSDWWQGEPENLDEGVTIRLTLKLVSVALQCDFIFDTQVCYRTLSTYVLQLSALLMRTTVAGYDTVIATKFKWESHDRKFNVCSYRSTANSWYQIRIYVRTYACILEKDNFSFYVKALVNRLCSHLHILSSHALPHEPRL